jgi:cell division protein FtsB
MDYMMTLLTVLELAIIAYVAYTFKNVCDVYNERIKNLSNYIAHLETFNDQILANNRELARELSKFK